MHEIIIHDTITMLKSLPRNVGCVSCSVKFQTYFFARAYAVYCSSGFGGGLFICIEGLVLSIDAARDISCENDGYLVSVSS